MQSPYPGNNTLALFLLLHPPGLTHTGWGIVDRVGIYPAAVRSADAVLDLDQAKSILNLIDLLEDQDDIQTIHANYEIPDDVAAQLAQD